VEIKPQTEMAKYNQDTFEGCSFIEQDESLAHLKPVMKKQTVHNSKNVFLIFKSIEI
jgi:hypothetical protein